MRKFGKESTAPAEGVDRTGGIGWLQNHSALAVIIIAVLALVLRTVFVYGVSADGNFALSGGTTAQYHLHVVESILNGSFIMGYDAAINYPIGGLNTNPPIYDFLAAAIGSFSSASFGLAVLAPIFGALTVFPVYLIGKEIKDDTIGVIAALIYALMALPINSSVFSNGNEFAFTAFLFAIFTLALIRVVRKVNNDELAIKETVITGIILGIIALSWNGFRLLFVMLILTMVIQIVLDRFNSKDFKVPLFTYSIILLIGLVLGAVYYIPAGLWDAVFSGPVLITAIAVGFGFIFKVLESKPWIFVIPGLVLAFVIITLVLFFAAPDLCTALLVGNTVFVNEIVVKMASFGVTISAMSSYYGWLLMWMPISLGLYELYKYAMVERTHTKLAYTMWLIIPWLFAWGSHGAAVVAGCVFAVSSSIVIVTIIRKADLKAYWTSMRNAGFPGFLRKMIKPLPFLSVIIATFLVIVPGLVYAVDAGISSNEDYGYFSYGNTTFTVETGDSYPFSYIYDDLKESGDYSKAIESWIEYSNDLAAIGALSVNSYNAEGASAVAHTLLSEGSAGATAAQIVRLMYANPEVNFGSAFGSHTDVCDAVAGYIGNPQSAVDKVLADTSVYGNINSDVTKENAIYFVSIKEITENMSTVEIMKAYESSMTLTGDSIGYYIIDGSMLPLVYGDGDTLSTIASFAGYSTDSYGAPTQFYTLVTYYSNYYPAMATDALYDTFLWKALIGPSATDLGNTNSFSLLIDLSTSNGKVKAMPGSGLAGYQIASWYLKYNESSNATTSDDGWKYMTYEEAMDLQSKNGGSVNYLSSIILYEYVGTGANTITKKIVNADGEPMAGITVEVTSYNSAYGANTIYSETTSGNDGTFIAQVPSTSYALHFKSGTVKLDAEILTETVTIADASFLSKVYMGDTVDEDCDYMYILTKDGKDVFIQTEAGIISSENARDSKGNEARIMPGTYTYKILDNTSTSVGSGSVTLYPGFNSGLMVSPTVHKLTVDVLDYFGNDVSSGTVVATNSSTGDVFSAAISKGEAILYLPNASYTIGLTDGYVTLNTSSVTMSQDRTVSVTAYSAVTLNINQKVAVTAYGGDYSGVTVDQKISLPTSIGATAYGYTLYGLDSTSVYYGVYTQGSTVTLTKAVANKVSGSIGASGMVNFIMGDAVFTAVSGPTGQFDIMLPAGNYTVWAYTSDNKVYIGSETISADVTLEKYDMVSGREISVTYKYASSTSKGEIGLPFATAKLGFTYESAKYTVPGITGSDGSVSFVVPKEATSASVSINGGSINNNCFNSSSLTATIEDGSENVKQNVLIGSDSVVKQNVSAGYKMTLKPYESETVIDFNGSAQLAPGSYTAEINATTGHYFKGVVYVYPGQTSFSGLNVIDVYGVEIVKRDIDEMTITGDKTHNNYNGGDIYYFEYDCPYYISTTASSTGYIGYGYLYVAKGTTAPAKLDVSTQALVKIIEGYVGTSGNGTVTASYGDVVVTAEVDSGAFTMRLPSDVKDVNFYAEVTRTIDGTDYGYSGMVDVADISSGVVNIPVASTNGIVEYTDDLEVCINHVKFELGIASVNLTIFNNTDTAKAYVVTAGPAWTLDESKQVMVAANSTSDVVVTGTYEYMGTGIGSMGMSVTVKDFNGTNSVTTKIIDGNNTSGDSNIVMKVASESDNKDKLSGSEYMYALTFDNNGPADKVKIDVTVESGYSIMLMSEAGEIIGPSGSEFVVPAQSSTIVYAKVMSLTGEMTTAPGITVKSTADNGDRSLSPSSISVEVDSMTVSGDTAVDHKTGIPMGVWFIFGVCILLLILIVWMGSKRGVFARK